MMTHGGYFSPWLDRREIFQDADQKEMATGHQYERSILSASSCPERNRLTEKHHTVALLQTAPTLPTEAVF